jgi:hypothetical protein
LQKIAKRKSDLRLYADELGKGLVGELDYSIEAANASKFLVLTGFPFKLNCSQFSYIAEKKNSRGSMNAAPFATVQVALIKFCCGTNLFGGHVLSVLFWGWESMC